MQGQRFMTKCAWCDALKMGSVWVPKPFAWVVAISMPRTPITHSICQKCLRSQFSAWHHEQMDKQLTSHRVH